MQITTIKELKKHGNYIVFDPIIVYSNIMCTFIGICIIGSAHKERATVADCSCVFVTIRNLLSIVVLLCHLYLYSHMD